MINKSINNERASEAKKIAQKYGLAEQGAACDQFIARNNAYKAHILMIGGYSAGKSALLNKYIGKDVLRENQGPETDIAAELYFSENEQIIANLLDGTKKKVLSIDEVNVDETRNVEYYLNSENIKVQSDYILVDTPGFDSGIEKHNKALMQYIDRGTAFILVVDCEKGTISESTLKFVNEVTNYSADIAVIINKCDKKIEEDVQEIKEHIEDLLETSTGRTFPVICTSIYDTDVAKKMKQLVNSFNPQYLYDKNITSEIKKRENDIICALELMRDKATCDTNEIENEIAKRETARKKLLQQIEQQKKQMGTKLHNEVKEKIISNIHSQLMCNANTLASAYKGGVDLFQERVIEIVRPIMISEVENYSSVAYDDFLKHINYSGLSASDNVNEIQDVIESVYGKLMDLNASGKYLLPSENKDNDDAEKSGLKVYRTVSSILAIATDAIAPPLELLIVFLPDIINLLNALLGNTKEHQLVEAIQNKIIPQIISKIRTKLDKSLSQVETVMVNNISTSAEEILNIENEALDAAKNKKTELENTHSEFIASVNADIEILRK